MSADQSGPTPPQIVARARKPPDALLAFITQELEHWGFDLAAAPETDTAVAVTVGGLLRVEVRWAGDHAS